MLKLVPGTRSNQCVVVDDDQRLHKNGTGVKERSMPRGGRMKKEGRKGKGKSCQKRWNVRSRGQSEEEKGKEEGRRGGAKVRRGGWMRVLWVKTSWAG